MSAVQRKSRIRLRAQHRAVVQLLPELPLFRAPEIDVPGIAFHNLDIMIPVKIYILVHPDPHIPGPTGKSIDRLTGRQPIFIVNAQFKAAVPARLCFQPEEVVFAHLRLRPRSAVFANCLLPERAVCIFLVNQHGFAVQEYTALTDHLRKGQNLLVVRRVGLLHRVNPIPAKEKPHDLRGRPVPAADVHGPIGHIPAGQRITAHPHGQAGRQVHSHFQAPGAALQRKLPQISGDRVAGNFQPLHPVGILRQLPGHNQSAVLPHDLIVLRYQQAEAFQFRQSPPGVHCPAVAPGPLLPGFPAAAESV